MSFGRPILASARQLDIPAQPGQVTFAFPLPLFDPADLTVLLQVAPVPLFQPVTNGVTVTLTPGLSQAVVTFAQAPMVAGGPAVTVRLLGRRVQSRISNVTRGGTISSVALEDELDRESIVLQELRRDVDAAVLQAGQALMLTQGVPLAQPAVSLWQLRRALAARGEMPAVMAWLNALPTSDPRTIAWTSRDAMFAPTDPFIVALGQQLADGPGIGAARLALASTFTLLPGPSSTAYRSGLALAGLYATVEQAVPADPADPTNIDWSAAAMISPAGRVAALAAQAVASDPIAALALINALPLPVAAGPFCGQRQLRAALGALGKLGRAEQAVQALPGRQVGLGGQLGLLIGDLAAIEWQAGAILAAGGPLMTTLGLALGYTPGQVAALVLYASEIAFS